MKIVTRLGKDIGSQATDGEINFVVPTSASSLSRVFFASTSRNAAQDFILSHEWNFETPKEND